MDEPATPGAPAALRQLPAVGTLLAAPELAPLIAQHGRAAVTDAVREAIEGARAQVRAGVGSGTVSTRAVAEALNAHSRRTLVRVVNGTGVLLHTNLGRAVLADAAKAAVMEVASGYASLELDLDEGGRGSRHAHVNTLLAELLGTDGGLALNNCAGAVFLMLAALCRGREVIVARGELVEIGGGFRVPDVMAESGARLVEVGTTNKVYARDYAMAVTEETAAIMVVHRSNFAIVGFTAEPSLAELAAVARDARVPLLVDLGSGLLAPQAALGAAAAMVSSEPRPDRALAEGADLVAFSGDKLLGGPQAGILAGQRTLLDLVESHPLARALRADKLTLAALEATLRLYRAGRASEIPVVRDLATPIEAIAERAQRVRAAIASRTNVSVEIVDSTAVPGGGSLPLVELPSKAVLVGSPGAPGRALSRYLREGEPPLVTRTLADRAAIDVRTILEDEVEWVGRLVAQAHGKVTEAGEK